MRRRRRHLAVARARHQNGAAADVLLVDTSVWIDHFRQRDARLSAALEAGEVLTHPFVIGELACGALRNRATVLELLAQLPSAASAAHDEVMHLIDSHKLAGTGVGWIDAHLVAAVRITGATLWTHDAALQRAWQRVARN